MRSSLVYAFAGLVFAVACGGSPGAAAGRSDDSLSSTVALGAHDDGITIAFGVTSVSASRIELEVFADPHGDAVARFVLAPDDATHVWSVAVNHADLKAKGIGGVVYYGYRAWGPNWPFDPEWTAGTDKGFLADVDADGHRFNPNKLLLDPYALETSHDPLEPTQLDAHVYASGPDDRTKDSGRAAPKGIVLRPDAPAGTKPTRALKDDVVYEAHVRGLTMNDPSVPADERGTYAGAARKAGYLHALGVTAIEFLPIQETQNDTNDVTASTDGDNYWGYMTLDYFAPDRRYAKDRTPGGPTRELQAMVSAFHAAGIKVYTDVVYNHTGEGGLWDGTGNVANVLSWRGLDNPTYYALANDKRFSWDNTGVGGNFNTANEITRNLVIASLRHWKDVIGVDGFRFDLASVLGNSCAMGCFSFDKLDPKNALNRLVEELPVRPADGGAGADLIAEPWAVGNGTYQLGQFPSGWAEWNGSFRDTVRTAQNELGQTSLAPGQLAARFSGSPDLFQDDGRKPWHSINFLACHDGFTLHDLYSYDEKNNGQPWPFGPSDGGETHNLSWDQGGDAAAQRQAARTALALLAVVPGVPMISAGDEMLRTTFGNNNAYNLDSEKSWLDWSTASPPFADFVRGLFAFRAAHPALRPADFFDGTDHDGNGLPDVAWYTATERASSAYMADASQHYLGYRIDGAERGDAAASIYVGYNAWSGPVGATLPANLAGKRWYLVADTASETLPDATTPVGTNHDLAARSVVILVER